MRKHANLVHPSIGEEKGGVVQWNGTRASPENMVTLDKVIDEHLADFLACERGIHVGCEASNTGGVVVVVRFSPGSPGLKKSWRF